MKSRLYLGKRSYALNLETFTIFCLLPQSLGSAERLREVKNLITLSLPAFLLAALMNIPSVIFK
ncbi:hypothetical protein QE390_004338 [Siphonobacter sp. SORGH_AS 1065]|nr:hypothetical protein [Siphonobacter sp. SORGH_AS_1065]